MMVPQSAGQRAAGVRYYPSEPFDRTGVFNACLVPPKLEQIRSNSVKGTLPTNPCASSVCVGSSRGLNGIVSSTWFPTRFGTLSKWSSPLARMEADYSVARERSAIRRLFDLR